MPNRSLSDRNLSHRLLTGGLLACCFAAAADARVLLTVEEALALAFPDAQVERTTVFLTTDGAALWGASAGPGKGIGARFDAPVSGHNRPFGSPPPAEVQRWQAGQ